MLETIPQNKKFYLLNNDKVFKRVMTGGKNYEILSKIISVIVNKKVQIMKESIMS